MASFNCNSSGGSTQTINFSTYNITSGYYKFIIFYNYNNTDPHISNILYLCIFEMAYDTANGVSLLNTTYPSGTWNINTFSSGSGGFTISNSGYASSYNVWNLYRMKMF